MTKTDKNTERVEAKRRALAEEAADLSLRLLRLARELQEGAPGPAPSKGSAAA